MELTSAFQPNRVSGICVRESYNRTGRRETLARFLTL